MFWSILDTYADPPDALDVWYSLFLDVENLHAPFRNKRVKKKKQFDWISDTTVKAMSQRNHFKSIGDNCNYKHWRNKCVSLIRSAKVEFYRPIIKSGEKDSSVSWKYLRVLAPKESKINSFFTQDGGKSVLNPTVENTKPGNLQHLESFLSVLLSHND